MLLFNLFIMSNSLWPHGLQHARLTCPTPSPEACSNSCPLGQWCHATISSSEIPLSSCLPSFLASVSFPMSQFFASGGQSIGASASVLPVNIQDWFPLRLTGLISLQSKGLSRVFSNTTVQKHQFFLGPPSTKSATICGISGKLITKFFTQQLSCNWDSILFSHAFLIIPESPTPILGRDTLYKMYASNFP